uniref:SH2 domain-containing protein n=1 Tax=Timema genevievae TaxID=629358 RepID=A0A7R9JSR2_TIMGE|nr:unnamed protein product [Timema genevievae]
MTLMCFFCGVKNFPGERLQDKKSTNLPERQSETDMFIDIDGTFLVRESNTAAGDFVLSLLHEGEVIHYQIRRHGEDAFFSIDCKHEQRANIKFCVLLRKSGTETFQMMQQAYGNEAMRRPVCFDWHSRFRSGRTSLKDEERSGKPFTSTNTEIVARVRQLVRKYRRMAIKDISYMVNEQTIIHGLETLIEYYQGESHGLATKLNKVCKKDTPPHDSRRHGRTNLLHRATKEGNYTVVSELLKCGYRSLEAKNQDGQTAVHLASRMGKDDILKKLIESGANINCRDTAGYTPLHVSLLSLAQNI